jgi:hypothetical protein
MSQGYSSSQDCCQDETAGGAERDNDSDDTMALLPAQSSLMRLLRAV